MHPALKNTSIRALGGKVLRKVRTTISDHAVTAMKTDLFNLRNDLDRYRNETDAELALLRAELEGRSAQ